MSNGLHRPSRSAVQGSNLILKHGLDEMVKLALRYGAHEPDCDLTKATESACPCRWAQVEAVLKARGDADRPKIQIP